MMIKQAILTIMGLILISPMVFGQAKGNINYQERGALYPQNRNFISGGSNQQKVFTPNTQAYFRNDSTIQLGARVLMNVPAQSYMAILSVTQAGKTAKICNETIEQRILNFKNAIKSLGFQESEIYTDFISQVPTFEYEIEKKMFSKTANEVPTGFELKKNIHLYFKNIKTLDQVMVLAADQEIYDLVKVDYYIDQKALNSIYDSLRHSATQVIEKKLKTLESLDFKFDSTRFAYKTFSENLSSVYPVERYSSYKAFSTTQIQSPVKVRTNIKKTPTYFYDKVPYNNYDAVINPMILEPAVQFSYVLEVRYSLKKAK